MRGLLALARCAGAFARAGLLPPRPATTLLALLGPRTEPLDRTLTRLGPAYIKLGQLLSTRPDIVGSHVGAQLSRLQDRLPAFSHPQAQESLAAEGLSHIQLGEVIAAASLAQVHKGQIKHNGQWRPCAIKLLRPGIEARMEKNLRSFARLARVVEARKTRLKLTQALTTLQRTTALEMDLRLEAAAMTHIAQQGGFEVPTPYLATRRALVMGWVEGTKADEITPHPQGKVLAHHLINTFLRHALTQGVFHADMHPGNIFLSTHNTLILVDFGVMGYLDIPTRYFLGRILSGLLRRDYMQVAQNYKRAGYLPPHQDLGAFAQALATLVEETHRKSAEEISMGQILGRLLEITAQFEMILQPQLLLLQKTMLAVEGLARRWDPTLNVWAAAKPALTQWQRTMPLLVGREIAENLLSSLLTTQTPRK